VIRFHMRRPERGGFGQRGSCLALPDPGAVACAAASSVLPVRSTASTSCLYLTLDSRLDTLRISSQSCRWRGLAPGSSHHDTRVLGARDVAGAKRQRHHIERDAMALDPILQPPQLVERRAPARAGRAGIAQMWSQACRLKY